MSLYSVDSLEPVDCASEIKKSCIDYEAEVRDGDGKRNSEELSIAVSSSSSRKIADSLAPIGKSFSRSSKLILDNKLKNDKKLSGVLPPVVIEAKAKPKTYLELYRERAGVPIAPRVYSPEGSTLSTLGDTSYESIPDVGSRPPTSTPRDDQSELSFYRRLIQQPRTTRSCEADQRHMGDNDRMNSVSECFLGTDKRRPSYRPYSIRDYECLTVPPADRSLGPDPVETRTKWEKLMRRTDYGDLASSRNRQNIVHRSELRKNFRGVLRDQGQASSRTPAAGAKNASHQSRRCGNKQMLTVHPLNNPKSSFVERNRVDPPSSKSSGERLDVSSLEDLQRRHQNEKRVMDLLINRTLLG